MLNRFNRTWFHKTALRRPHLTLTGSALLIAAAVATGALFNEAGAPAARAHDAAVAGAAGVARNAAAELATVPQSAAPAPAPPAEKEVHFDFQFQPNYYYCGPASTRIALSSSGIALSQDEIARRLGTTENGTNSAAETTRVLNGALGKDVYQTHWIPGQRATAAETQQLQHDVVTAISGDRALVANIVGGATDAVGVYHEFSGGHFISLVGYRDNGAAVEVADPSGMYGPRTYWMATTAMANWVAARGYSA